jgi:DNA mismatch endonuclease, patch repair protein
MPDTFNSEKRSEIMSRIKGKNSKPELLVRSLIHRLGYRFRVHVNDLPGKPDVVLKRHKKAVFVHGCFWHGHKGCARSKRPSTNTEFWNLKLSKNTLRDAANQRLLKEAGWSILVIWQCETRDHAALEETLKRFLEQKHG